MNINLSVEWLTRAQLDEAAALFGDQAADAPDGAWGRVCAELADAFQAQIAARGVFAAEEFLRGEPPAAR